MTRTFSDGSYVALQGCYFCGKEKGVLLHTHLWNVFPPGRDRVITDMEPCNNCKAHMDRGMIFLMFYTCTEDKMSAALQKASEDVADNDRRSPRNKRPYLPIIPRLNIETFVSEDYFLSMARSTMDEAIQEEMIQKAMKARFCVLPIKWLFVSGLIFHMMDSSRVPCGGNAA